jgi:hypothetical protein
MMAPVKAVETASAVAETGTMYSFWHDHHACSVDDPTNRNVNKQPVYVLMQRFDAVVIIIDTTVRSIVCRKLTRYRGKLAGSDLVGGHFAAHQERCGERVQAGVGDGRCGLCPCHSARSRRAARRVKSCRFQSSMMSNPLSDASRRSRSFTGGVRRL